MYVFIIFFFENSSYLIVAPRSIRPAEKIKISCSIMNKYWNNMIVKALIFTDEQEIASGFQEILTNVPNTIALTVNIFEYIFI